MAFSPGRDARSFHVDAIAVCYPTPTTNAVHEVETGKALAVHLPGAYVTLSSDVVPQSPRAAARPVFFSA